MQRYRRPGSRLPEGWSANLRLWRRKASPRAPANASADRRRLRDMPHAREDAAATKRFRDKLRLASKDRRKLSTHADRGHENTRPSRLRNRAREIASRPDQTQ